jgi:hypothetical protein
LTAGGTIEDLKDHRLRNLARDVVLRAAEPDRGWRTAYRIRRLIRAGDRGAQIAVDAVWECWLQHPDERWWTALLRWRRPADPLSGLDSGLFDPEQVHRLSVAALDNPASGWSPKGLAEALAREGHPIAGIARQRLRDSAWLLHIIVNETPPAISHLTREMVRDHDWDGLWRFARDLPPIVAVEALRDAGPGWRPPDRDGAELYTLLRAADPRHLRERVEALAEPRVLEVDRPVFRGAFSADERLVAVTVTAGLRVFDVETGSLVEAHELDEPEPGPVSFEGDRPILAQRWPGESARSTIWRFGPGRLTGRSVNSWVYELMPGTLDGSTQVASVRRIPGDQWPGVSLVRRHGPPSARRPEGLVDQQCVVLDTDPVDRRVAFAGDRVTVVGLGPANRLRRPVSSGYRPPRDWRGICLAGPDLVFTCDADQVIRWLIDDDGWLKVTTTRRHAYGRIVWAAHRNAVVVTDTCHGVQYLDADTLEPQDRPGELSGLHDVRTLWSAPRGTGSHAAAVDGEIRLILAPAAALAHLARQPMNESSLASVPNDPVARDRAGPLLDILAANDRYRASVRSSG